MEKTTSALQREIRQSQPFRSHAQEAAIGLLRTASLVRRHLSAVVEPYGLTFPQYNALRILRGARAPLPTMEIRDRLIEETPNTTRIVSHLEREGLVHRERCAEDQRRILCTITPAGLDLLGKIDDAMDEADKTSVDGLSDSQQQALIELLDAVRAGLTS